MVAAIGLVVMAGCHLPVDPDAEVFVRGRVLDLDGQPAAGQTIELYKSTTPFWLYGEWLESILENEGNTFRTTTTDADGQFEIMMTGAEANSPGGGYAAYFAVAVFADSDRQMAVVTEDHFFSNADLIWNLPEMQFWDVGSQVVDQQTLYMDFSWPDLPKNATHDFLFYVNDGDWAQWVDANATSLVELPVEVLNPATSQCSWQVIAWSTGLRYRSDRHTFSNQNIFSPVDNALATDGDGNELPGITDGEYTDKQYFTEATDKRSVILDLRAPHQVTAFVVHHAWIFNWWAGTATISTSMDGINWDLWRQAVQGDQEEWGLFYHYVIDMQGVDCQYIKIELSGPDGVYFDYIGELVAFGSPL
jgi:hypothetical protein